MVGIMKQKSHIIVCGEKEFALARSVAYNTKLYSVIHAKKALNVANNLMDMGDMGDDVFTDFDDTCCAYGGGIGGLDESVAGGTVGSLWGGRELGLGGGRISSEDFSFANNIGS